MCAATAASSAARWRAFAAATVIYLVTNNEWNWFVYNGFEVTVSKRSNNLTLLGSYGRNFQHIDGTWQPNDPASFIQPDHFANDKGLGSVRGNVFNSLSGDADIRSPSWQKHVLRIGGTRVTLDTVLAAHRAGATPEEIVRRYTTLNLDIYAVISYALRNRDEVEAYLERRAQDAARVQRENEARFPPDGVRDRLLRRRASAEG